MNKDEYLQMYEEAWVNDGNVGVPELPGNRMSWAEAQAAEGTDWVQETIRQGIKHGYDSLLLAASKAETSTQVFRTTTTTAIWRVTHTSVYRDVSMQTSTLRNDSN